MGSIIEQVKEGLTAKVEGIQIALSYVRDEREIERLQTELRGATAGLAKLDEADNRTPEELEKIAGMINSDVAVETSGAPWSTLTPREKFKYQVELYSDKVKSAWDQATMQYRNLLQVVQHLEKTKGDGALFMTPIIKQFEGSLAEIDFSAKTIGDQLAIRDEAVALVGDEDFFDKLELLNRFLNNPMNLPHLLEEREAQIKELRSVKN